MKRYRVHSVVVIKGELEAEHAADAMAQVDEYVKNLNVHSPTHATMKQSLHLTLVDHSARVLGNIRDIPRPVRTNPSPSLVQDIADLENAFSGEFIRNPCGRLNRKGYVCVCGIDHSSGERRG